MVQTNRLKAEYSRGISLCPQTALSRCGEAERRESRHRSLSRKEQATILPRDALYFPRGSRRISSKRNTGTRLSSSSIRQRRHLCIRAHSPLGGWRRALKYKNTSQEKTKRFPSRKSRHAHQARRLANIAQTRTPKSCASLGAGARQTHLSSRQCESFI